MWYILCVRSEEKISSFVFMYVSLYSWVLHNHPMWYGIIQNSYEYNRRTNHSAYGYITINIFSSEISKSSCLLLGSLLSWKLLMFVHSWTWMKLLLVSRHNFFFQRYVVNFSYSWFIVAVKIESAGAIPPEVLFTEAVKILEEKCDRVICELS